MQPLPDGGEGNLEDTIRRETMHMTQCAGCGINGMQANTDAGEIIEDGQVVGTVPCGVEILRFGRVDGSCIDDLFCDNCAGVEKAIDR